MDSHLNRCEYHASRLSDAIYQRNLAGIRESIKDLIKNRVQVKVTVTEIMRQCSVHHFYNQSSSDRFSNSRIVIPNYCRNSHCICEDCCRIYVSSSFPNLVFQNFYECPGCLMCNITNNSKLFADDMLDSWLRYFMGNDHINQVISSFNRSTSLNSSNLQSACNLGCGNIGEYQICTTGHVVCKFCLSNWALNLAKSTEPIHCLVPNCQKPIFSKMLIEALGNSPFLHLINSKLTNIGVHLKYCYKCKFVVNLNPDQNLSETCNNCEAKICSYCGAEDHFGFTCFYSVSQNDYEEIELVPPQDIDHPVTILDWEWYRVRMAFNHYINPGEEVEFKSATLYVNKDLEKRYAEKKKKMAAECNGRENVNQLLIWHGSKKEFYPNIMKDGLKVGAVDGVEILQGKVHGFGVYTATTPNTPKIYAKDSKFVACFLALKGNTSPEMINDPKLLDNGKTHSYIPKGIAQNDWLVLFTKEQLLPRYLVEYKQKGT